jgi:hypothetical protein
VPTLCKCHKSPLTCKQVVLQRKKGSEGSFEIRKLSVPLNNLSHWDLAAFAHPRNPKFDDKKLLPRTRCSYLALDFEAVADKDNFTKSFRVAMILRDRADGLSRDALRMARHLEVGDSSNLEYLQKLRKQEASTMTTVGPIAKNNRLSSQPSSHPVIYFNN